MATFIIVLSVQLMLGYKLNNFTANIPIFIVAIGIADAVHIYTVWHFFRQSGEENLEAIKHTLQKNFMPIFLTSLTTSVGFASLVISDIIPVKTLGLATALGAILAFILSVVLMPTILLFIKDIKKSKKRAKNFNQLYKKFATFLIYNDKKIVFFVMLLFSFFAIGIYYVKIDSNIIKYFKEDVEIRKSSDFLMQNLTGPMSYEIIIGSKVKEGIKEPLFLQTVDKFCKEYKEKFQDIRHISSLVDVVKRFHKVMNANQKEYYKIPQNRDLIAQYLLLYSLSLPQGMEINDKIDIKERVLRVTAQVNLVDTSKDLEMIKWAKEWWQNSPYSLKIEGQTAMFAYMQHSITKTLLESISIAFIFVSIMMLLIFKKLKMLIVFLIPNLFPIILVIGIMGWLGINIDLGVAVSGAIILGVAADDTIHFFSKYFEARKEGKSLEEAFIYVFRYAGSAIVFTSFILTFSFLLFVWSDFLPNKNFGIVTASALMIALVCDLLLLPALLSLLEKREFKK